MRSPDAPSPNAPNPKALSPNAPNPNAPNPNAPNPNAPNPNALSPNALSPDEFVAHAREFNVVPVWRKLPITSSPPEAYVAVVGEEDMGFLLESVEKGERSSRYSFIGRRPRATLVLRNGHVQVHGDAVQVPNDEGILAAVEALLSSHSSPSLPLPPLHGGLAGYAGYDVVREIERVPSSGSDDLALPSAVFFLISQVVAFDHKSDDCFVIDNVFLEGDESDDRLMTIFEEAKSRLDQLEECVATAEHLEPVLSGDAVNPEQFAVASSMGSDGYRQAVVVAKDHVAAGDVFQVVLSQRFDVALEADPFVAYRCLRELNPGPYMYFLRHPEVTIVGSSPETMVQVRGSRIVSRPIAGTRPRGRSEAEDRMLGAQLLEHPKEIAEHVMLVDLARNDLGRVSEFGTVDVEELMTLERFSHVMHLTSRVAGKLRQGLSPIDVLRATFPHGTVTGAPKVRAMEIIDELEPTVRGPYAGAVGYFDFAGNADTAITLRTLLVAPDGTASAQAGAGIVYDSDPAAEDDECRNKAAAVLACVEAANAYAEAGGK